MQEEQILQLMQEYLTKRTDTQDNIQDLVSFRSDLL
jgi:hypothetical protein